MAEVEGYLQLRDEFGGCVDLVHNCRTIEYLRNSGTGGGFNPAQECEDCCCASIDDCVYTTPDDENEPAPWFDPLNPATAEFFGLWGSLNIAQPPAEAGVVPPKTLTFTGVALSSTRRGKAAGLDWISGSLTPFCVSCAGREATVYNYCPDGSCIQDEEDPDEPVEPVDPPVAQTLDISNIFDADGCEIPGADDPLTPAEAVEPLADTGRRDLLRVQYVNGSLQELVQDFPDCYGARVTFQFLLLDTETFIEGDPICEISPADLGGLDVPCRSICIAEPPPDLDSCGACGIPCECEATPAPGFVDTPASNVLADGAAECRYSAPLSCKRYACLIDPFAFTQAAPIVSIYAGSEDMTNVSVLFYQATTGLPNPMTALGAEIYANRAPESEALITRIPAGSTFTLDARTSKSTLDCPGFAQQSGAPLVSGCGGKKYRHPRLCCGLRYWVIIEVDCFTTTHDDWKLSGALNGIERT